MLSTLGSANDQGLGKRRPKRLIIGCDYHSSVQQIAWVDGESGECGELRLTHCKAAEQFYRELEKKGVSVRVGMETTGHSRWFERLLGELNYELWGGSGADSSEASAQAEERSL